VHKAGLVGEDDRLYPIAQAELHQDAAHVSLHRGLLHDQLLGDLTIGQALGQQAQHVDMRRVVGTLLERDQPVEPQPSLSQLDRLVERAGLADVHLHISGSTKVLPSVVELSAYRTLEHLLDAYGDVPGQRIDIEVDFASEALSLTVRGPAPATADIQTALASARARVDVHQGSLLSSFPGGQWETNVRLPLEDSA
jgi:hypothetical protein